LTHQELSYAVYRALKKKLEKKEEEEVMMMAPTAD
jgi:hypothetical protein